MKPTQLIKLADATRMPPLQAGGRPFVPLADVKRQAWGQSPRSSTASIPYALGNWAGNKLDSFSAHRGWGEKGPWHGALQYGAGAALAGTGLSALYNKFITPYTGTREVPLTGMAALSGLLGGWFGHMRGSNTQPKP
jgi:hypothetical protein